MTSPITSTLFWIAVLLLMVGGTQSAQAQSLSGYDAAISADMTNSLSPAARLTSAVVLTGAGGVAFNFGATSGDATIEFIVQGTPVPGGNAQVVATGSSASSRLCYEQYGFPGQVGFTRANVNDYVFTPVVPSPTVATHIAYVWDAAALSMKLYANGVLAGSATGPANFVMPSGAGYLGSDGSNGERMMSGTIHRVTVYDSIESAAAILRHANAYNTAVQDTNAPVITALYPAAGTVLTTLTSIEAHFSEGVRNVSAGSLLINGLPTTDMVASAPDVYAFSFPQPATGAVQVAWSGTQTITDLSANSNHFAGGAYTYTLVPMPPEPILQAAVPALTAVLTNGHIRLEWSVGGQLEWAPALSGSWTAVTPAPVSPYEESILTAQERFYRLLPPLYLVKNSLAAATIVIPAQPWQAESYAAQELQYHVRAATGVQLTIASEAAAPSGARVYLGRCTADAAAGVNPSALPGNGYIVKTLGRDLYIAGKDASGDPLSVNNDVGTLFGVYDLLENGFGVKWLWPGQLGEVIPTLSSMSIWGTSSIVQPSLQFREWRVFSSVDTNSAAFLHDEAVWLRRQRFGRSKKPNYGHSFGDWWTRFGTTHPEYFGMLPDGTRRPDPNNGTGYNVHMCVSQPGVVAQKVADWQASGTGEFLNICENDGWAGSADPTDLSWDVYNPTDGMDFSTRVARGLAAFNAGSGEWMLQYGSLSDRYARFWQATVNLAVTHRPDVKVISYAYDNYVKPPMQATLTSNVLIGFVPTVFCPYVAAESTEFRSYWDGWKATGCSIFIRPNYTLQGHTFPVFYARLLGGDLQYASAHGLQGADFDSLTGQYGAQAPTLYMLAKTLNHPTLPVDSVLDEFYAAFGPAKSGVRQYFEYWESVYNQYTDASIAALQQSKSRYGAGGNWSSFHIVAPQIYTSQRMSAAQAILNTAAAQASGNPTASAKVAWLASGLTHVQLVLNTELAYEHAVDTGDTTQYHSAHAALETFRSQNWNSRISNFAVLELQEARTSGWGRYGP